ncbi:oxidoreductase [Pseudoflavitalea sp. X16]|uniref:oxidoreductase n=1 Tax=Paraflavitalea devenefica TaxID=2716334 RepID=UPI00142364D5|nr:oxidoreductase [Paraflavitalea devenefica]NII27254.1 oxidoreductase [Paraflavitalea devenefica]
MAQPIRVGLVGFGISATVFHAPFFVTLPEYELVAVLERTKNESQKKYPFVRVVRSIEELVADPSIDLIVITTPNETHFPYSKAALQAGKHVVVEKPFTNTTAEAKELVELAATSGKILSVYQNRRYVSDFLTIRDLLDKKLLGDVHEFEGHYDRYRAEARPNAWREAEKPGSGILYDLGAHLIDQVLYLFGLPQSITADIRQQRPHAKVDDYFDLRLNYGFTKVILHAGMLVREPGPRYMIHGTIGSFVKYGEDPQEARLRAGALPEGEDWGQEPAAIYGLLHTEVNGELVRQQIPSQAGDYGLYYKNLYNTIVHQAQLLEKPEHGYNTVRMIELAIESHTRQCTIPCSGLINIPYR